MSDYEGGYTNEPTEGLSKLKPPTPEALAAFHQRRRDEESKREESRQAHMRKGACPHEFVSVDINTKREENPYLGTWTEDTSRTCVHCGAKADLGRRFNNWSGD